MASREEDTLTKSYYDLYKLQEKSPRELQEIVLRNGRRINAMPNTMTQAMSIEATKLLCEMKACNQILSEVKAEEDRKKQAEKRISDEKRNWRNRLSERKSAAILKLSAASSAEGQLIAAILEAEGEKTHGELKAWGEEFSEMDDKEFTRLLTRLCMEQIIWKKNDRYALATVCEEDLLPRFTEEYFNTNLASGTYKEAMLPLWNMFVSIPQAGLSPMSANEIIEFINNVAGSSGASASSRDYITKNIIRDMAGKGLLQKISAGTETLYDVSLLGEL